MKPLFICCSLLLFVFSSTASSFDTLVHEIDMDVRSYARRGDVLVPPSCSKRKTHPACSIKSPSKSSSKSSSKVSSGSSSVSAKSTTSSTSQPSSFFSNYANAGTATSSSQITLPTGESNNGVSASSGNEEITPVGGGNSAIKVDSVPTPLNGSPNAKRSSHGISGHSSAEVTVIESHTVTSIENDYVGFDWTQWNDLCDLGERETDFSCTGYGGSSWDSAFEADADVCLQQKFSDIMITHAKKFGGAYRRALIDQVLKYRRHPRKVVKILGVFPSTPYCLEEPQNSELCSVWNSQLDGVDFGIFGGPKYNLKVFGEEGTCPLGFKSDIESCGCITDVNFKKHKKSHKGHRKTKEHHGGT